MEHYVLKLAERVIGVDCLYPYAEKFCAGYLADDGAERDFSVSISEDDLAFERKKSESERALEGIEPRSFAPQYLETLAIYRKICNRMPLYDTFLMHGSVVAVDGEAYMFTAVSGTGKSTHAALWRKAFGARAVMVNDDKPLIRMTDAGAIAYGTPWNGKHHLGENIAVPLKAICYLTRAERNTIEPLHEEAFYPILAQQAYRPFDSAALLCTLRLWDRLLESVRLYRLGCNMDPEAAWVAYNGMKERKD